MKPNWEEFARGIMESWPHGDVDSFELQDLAIEYGLIVEDPEGYNYDKHGESDYGVEEGDTWYVLNYTQRPLKS